MHMQDTAYWLCAKPVPSSPPWLSYLDLDQRQREPNKLRDMPARVLKLHFTLLQNMPFSYTGSKPFLGFKIAAFMITGFR